MSVDGAHYAIVDGEWTRVRFADRPKDRDTAPFSLPDGHVSVDGGTYAIIDGEWRRVGAAGNPNGADEEPFSLPDGHVSVDGALYATVDGEWQRVGAAARTRGPADGQGSHLVPWRAFNPEGDFLGLVLAQNALEAIRSLPPGCSVYVGGPSATEPERSWWVDAWNSGTVRADDLLGNDPR